MRVVSIEYYKLVLALIVTLVVYDLRFIDAAKERILGDFHCSICTDCFKCASWSS